MVETHFLSFYVLMQSLSNDVSTTDFWVSRFFYSKILKYIFTLKTLIYSQIKTMNPQKYLKGM